MQDPVKALRDSLGLNQKEFAEEIGVVQSCVSEWERGASLSTTRALELWDRYGRKLRGLGFKFTDLVRPRGTKPRPPDRSGDEAAA